MKRILFPPRVLVLVLALGSLAGPGAAMGEAFNLTVVEKAPPEEVATDLRALLAHKSYAISEDGGAPFYEFWFVKEIEVRDQSPNSLNPLEVIHELTFMGVLVVHKERRDFRDDPVAPGTYTLRMGLQPQDGNHMGTAPYNTFLVLIPHAKDAEIATFRDHDHMIDTSSEGTAAKHPPILSLQPVASEGELPRLAEGGDDWHFLVLKLNAKAGDKTAELPIQVVFEGMGEL